jgi:beta-barrel assembly-enhancing protease
VKSLFVVLMLCLFVASCATTAVEPITGRQPLALHDDEKRIWLRSEEEEKVLLKSGLVYDDAVLQTYVNGVAQKLQPPEVLDKVPFKVLLLKNSYLNAFAYPNGMVFVHTGIVARMENEAQLAALLAHEMTHTTYRHAVSSFRDLQNKTAALSTMSVVLMGFGGIGTLASALGTIGTLASVTGYSRQLETEADVEGLKLVVQAGYDPEQARCIFTLLKQEVDEEKIQEPFFFGSHPRLQERIDNYDALLNDEYKDRKGGVKNEEIFITMTYQLVLDNAVLDLKAGRFTSAERAAEKMLKTKPDDKKAYYLLGETARQRGLQDDTAKAISGYERAIALDSSYADPYKGLGLVRLKAGEKQEAKKLFESYLALQKEARDRAYVEAYIRECSKGETP